MHADVPQQRIGIRVATVASFVVALDFAPVEAEDRINAPWNEDNLWLFDLLRARQALPTFESVFQKWNMEEPVRKVMCVLELHEESGEHKKRADEEVPEDAAVLDVENRSAQQAQSLRHETHQQIDEKESGEAEDF